MTDSVQTLALDAARKLIDFRGRDAISGALAKQQLEGAVAIHNILATERVAYLADEVGLGKTYVALGAVALLRYFQDEFKVLYIAPRENIQLKWVKELRNFTLNNWRHTDGRVRSLQDKPAQGIAVCHRLLDWVEETSLDPRRDVFLRLTSFSFGLSDDPTTWRAQRDLLLDAAPAISAERIELGHDDKSRFKEDYARALNLLLPHYDLVVVDEAHNLKKGRESNAARNRLVEIVLGHDRSPESRAIPGYGPRFDRVLLLSATPLEWSFHELWNQLDLFGFGKEFEPLKDPELPQAEKQTLSSRILIRRLGELEVNGHRYTKNMYRREWRRGGMAIHGQPLAVPDAKQRLVVALVQKKVAELLQEPRFGNSFQIGMLASFESFLETAKVANDEEDPTFDQTEQTADQIEREGIDTPSVNQLARSYRRRFGEALPHPKMDALVDALAPHFETGEKTLVFVRRVKSVPELAEKLNRRYDRWLYDHLRTMVSGAVQRQLDEAIQTYEQERRLRDPLANVASGAAGAPPRDAGSLEESDRGGHDTFFAWFFRGEGPPDVLSGAAFRRNRLRGEGSVYSVFFEDNYVLDVLGITSGALGGLARRLNRPPREIAKELRERAWAELSKSSRKRQPRFRIFHAYQEAALWLLAHSESDLAETARIIVEERYRDRPSRRSSRVPDNLPDPDGYLDSPTFFSELRKHPELRGALWPDTSDLPPRESFLDRERRRELLASASRLGHTFIDLWCLAVERLGSLDLRTREASDERVEDLIHDFLDLLERQSRTDRFWAYRELFLLGQHHDQIHAVNFPEALQVNIPELPTLYGQVFREQAPVGGMWGSLKSVIVKQFRLPGYPLMLVTTDLLQEGEDLHTFCSRVVHYGISWTPSALEQRTGRVDRIGSLVHRRLDRLEREPEGEELLQVYYPYLEDSVERLQVARVLERMNRFIRLLHRGWAGEEYETRIDTNEEFARLKRDIEAVRVPLESRFRIAKKFLEGQRTEVGDPAEAVRTEVAHFDDLLDRLSSRLGDNWHQSGRNGEAYGELSLEGGRIVRPEDSGPNPRVQPLALFLRPSGRGATLLHAVSPVGEIPDLEAAAPALVELQNHLDRAKICTVRDRFDSYTVTVEGDVLLHPELTQTEEVLDLVTRVCEGADAIERRWLPGQDAPLTDFHSDLRRETVRGADD